MSQDPRLDELTEWTRATLGAGALAIAPASGDASFRRYFRAVADGRSWIVMDAPPERENVTPFIAVAETLARAGVQVPRLHAIDRDRGYLLLDDLGSRLYLPALTNATADGLYGDALGALATMQAAAPCADLPPYDEALLRREMALFPDWLLGRHLGLEPEAAERSVWEVVQDILVANALEQPRVFVHRDYHSRNLMCVDARNPGVLDFQDAVCGPVTYDLVSLLKDCYIAWPRARVVDWAMGYFRLAAARGVLDASLEMRWLRWFDLMGVQRHLKAAGIFARLNHRDGKAGYLPDIPRTLGYITAIADEYPELGGLAAMIERHVAPHYAALRAGR
ncbi:MAG: phosphotransferase [Chromatiales bacterium]|nr:phosphotransferase [Chromatiales bacterium]